MTPYKLDILLHYYAIAEDHPATRGEQKIWQHTYAWFKDQNLMELAPPEKEPSYIHYKLTSRGKAYIQHLLSCPLPEMQWVFPCDRKEPSCPEQ